MNLNWRRVRIGEIRSAIAEHGLIWFGTRGTDAIPLVALMRPKMVVSQTAPLVGQGWQDVEQRSLEVLTERRVDVNNYDLDRDKQPAAVELRTTLMDAACRDNMIVPYRSAEFLSWLTVTARTHLLSPFHSIQRLFEQKAWVEGQFRRLGLPTIGWTTIQSRYANNVQRLLEQGPVVVREGLGAGGAQLHLVRSVNDYLELVELNPQRYVSISRYVEDAIPLNINACVFDGCQVETFALSYQLIGIEACTRRQFGFCGNDYYAASAFPTSVVSDVSRLAVEVGQWLYRFEYRGVFGLDLLLVGERPLICELNPRFQGSTPLCAGICAALDESDPFLEHIAACLGLKPQGMGSCSHQTAAVRGLKNQTFLSQVLYHNTALLPQVMVQHRQSNPVDVELICVPSTGVRVAPDALFFKGLFPNGVTSTGYEISDRARKFLDEFEFRKPSPGSELPTTPRELP